MKEHEYNETQWRRDKLKIDGWGAGGQLWYLKSSDRRLSAPSLPTCFGVLTSSGDVIKKDIKEISKAMKRPGISCMTRSTSVFPTSNINYETKLMAQTLRKDASSGALKRSGHFDSISTSQIQVPISNRAKLDLFNK